MRLACAGLLPWLEKGITVVTPTPLLAAVAAEEFSKNQLACGIESWQRPSIISIGAWLTARWQEARYASSDAGTLLSPSQERVLWQRVIRETNADLFDVNATAVLAMRAARLLSEWLIRPEGEIWANNEDARQFQQWHKRFHSECAQNGWITRADLWQLVPKWAGQGQCAADPTAFACFSAPPPVFRSLRKGLGNSITEDSAAGGQASGIMAVLPLADAEAEWEHAARWSRAAFESEPALSIGVIVPDLSGERAGVERTFTSVWYPSGPQGSESAFHVNAGAFLSDEPLVASALLLLELAREQISIADASAILRCPFLRGASLERGERALADLKLRKTRSARVSLRDIEYAASTCSELRPVWPRICGILKQPTMLREFSGWSTFFGKLLSAAGWPGDFEFSEREQDVLQAWENALADLSGLGLVCGAVSLEEALGQLKRLLPGAPHTGTWSSPVQILSPSDAAGIEFDRVLATGLGDETWPPRVNLSPFIPVKVQQAHGIPGAGAEALRAEAERAAVSLRAAAPIVRGTYSGRLAPSIQPFTALDTSVRPLWVGKQARESYVPAQLAHIEDYQAPPYSSQDPAHGGAALLKSQSLCPFRAFMEYRLHVRPLEESAIGFDARERGGFLHKALQIVWQRVQTQQCLNALTPDELKAIVAEAAEQAVRPRQLGALEQVSSQAERQRLNELILEWLEIERARKIPFIVETLEGERLFEAPGLKLQLRVDRIDRLPDGSVLLMDYKSGSMSRERLKCPRPHEPQLLVYAAACEDQVDGFFFVELQSRNARAVGAGRDKYFNSHSVDVKGDAWDSVLSGSEAEVARLAGEFVSGYAAVDPISGACNYCPAASICRVKQARAGEENGG